MSQFSVLGSGARRGERGANGDTQVGLWLRGLFDAARNNSGRVTLTVLQADGNKRSMARVRDYGCWFVNAEGAVFNNYCAVCTVPFVVCVDIVTAHICISLNGFGVQRPARCFLNSSSGVTCIRDVRNTA